jgi:aromatic-amino-acid transaminase
MRDRVNGLRAAVAALPTSRLDMSPLALQSGIFALLPLTSDEVRAVRERHAVYLNDSGRINVAGINETNIDTFTAAIMEVDHQL